MRNRLGAMCLPLLIAFAAALASSQAPAAAPEWKEYSYADDGFALKSPAQLSLQKFQQPTASGNIEMRQYSLDLNKDTGVVMSVSDYPNGKSVSSKEALEEGVNGSIQATKATKTAGKNIQLQQVPGIEYEADTDAFHMMGRYYWQNGRLFAMLAVSPLGQPVPADVLKVMNSLKFLPVAQMPASQAPQWKQYSYPEDGFTVTAPSPPTFAKQEKPTDSGSLELRQYSVDMGGSVEIFISVSDIANTSHATPKAILEGAVNGSLPPTKATKLSEKDIALQQVPGVEFEATTGDYHLLGRYYWKINRLFTLLAVSPLNAPLPADALRVMDSLKFVEK